MTIDLSGGGNIGGKSFASLGLLLTKADIPILPETRQIEDEIPNKHGTIDLQTTFNARMIELTFELIEDFEIDYHVRLSEIASAFNPLKGQQILVLERNAGKQYQVKYNGSLSIEKIAQLGEFTIPLKAFNPFPESYHDADDLLELTDGYTLGMGYELTDSSLKRFNVTSSPTTFTVKHFGNHVTKPFITLNGGGSNITVTNNTTGESFTFNDDLAYGFLDIDCENYTARLNSLNVFHLLDGDFPVLVEGDNEFTVTSTTPNFTINFDFKHTYLY